MQFLDRLHDELAPTHYLEFGVRHGASLALARGPGTGVDPAPDINRELPAKCRVVEVTSDEFFAERSREVAPDLCFIDGMHLFEYALRDFMNVERCAAPGAVVVLDDIFPNHPMQAERERRTRVWTGDVWRLAETLRRHRPDLFLLALDVSPAGLLLVAGLDPTNRVLWEVYNPLVREARAIAGPTQSVLERRDAVDPAGPEIRRVLDALKKARAERCPPRETATRLRHARANDADEPRFPRTVKPKLSLVVVEYNMVRELPRTIRSLSPACNGISTRGTTKSFWSTTARHRLSMKANYGNFCPI